MKDPQSPNHPSDDPESSPRPAVFDSRAFLDQLTSHPGVYRMYDAGGALLYVGKARNLKKRVGSYFLRASGNPRIEAMVEQIRHIEVTVTHSEDEALLLEATLIKQLNPRYNILYRDDKSYPYLRISRHRFPRISFYRGAKQGDDRYFGPFPSSVSVRETLYTLQKLFQLRPCQDSFFNNRSRPCLQHQIRRCSGPCVGLIDEQSYAREVRRATGLLEGRGEALHEELVREMTVASEALAFERAARLRDQITALQRVRETRSIAPDTDSLDLVAVALHPSRSCLVVMSVRDGLNLGHRSYFPRHAQHAEPAELLESFLSQHYLEQPPPAEVLISHPIVEDTGLPEALDARAGRRVNLRQPQRGHKKRLMDMALSTAAQALSTHLTEVASMDQRLIELASVLGLEQAPRRMECFDISHTGGERAVASCVVFNEQGPQKNAYRRFNIDDITPGDDYAALKQAVLRRYTRIRDGEVAMPDVLFIDGGRGQLSAVGEALDELGIDDLCVVGVAKGPTRRPGMEELLLRDDPQRPLQLPPNSPALHLIQRIRDEAHRFALTGHRGRREKARVTSGLESIEGLGPARRRALLQSFGGLSQLRGASIDALARVPGISRKLAERIHAHFH